MARTDGNFASPLRRLLRHRPTHTYFKDGGWTANAEEAHNCSDILEAAQICARHGLSEVDLILRIEGATSDVFSTPLR